MSETPVRFLGSRKPLDAHLSLSFRPSVSFLLLFPREFTFILSQFRARIIASLPEMHFFPTRNHVAGMHE